MATRIRSSVGRLSRRVAERRRREEQRRAHDEAMRIPRVATEHSTEVQRARARGERGCTFCG